ncbi:peptidoglycan DD-metalloendopeptidase family protein [Sansalvadorimonas sp. 2012CJ34-2]|uniref:Peptidoglycan DD-metalloendopeptidase family protein n=1 Tax=Parendozoicomonas callyspongiae TaxID=2942213 RepID=A0ABT0PCU0_9GAMM|nr:peptidoglycan DD-metalloendopeptidase family protein [Sansalvadorimonas sp. 2012CJ34-2]MCL6269207.1 peptidoglycan DD-metalloendopeptidase family protein [Sansalvadorimonas sp. 2012CJ34-2]
MARAAIETAMKIQSLTFSLIMALLLVMPPSPAVAESDSARLERINRDIKELRVLLDKIRKERSSIETRLEQSEKELNRVKGSIRKTEKELKEVKIEEKKHQARRSELKNEQSRNQKVVAKAIKAAYVAGQDPQLKVILNQQSPSQAGRMMVYYDRFAQAQSDALLALRESDRKLALTEDKLVRASNTISDKKNRLAAQAKEMDAQSKERQLILAKLTASEKTSGSKLGRLEKEQQELQEILSSITTIEYVASIDKPFKKERGKMQWPVKGKILHRYGEKRSESKVPWNGVFINASVGTAVKAPHHGRVIFSDWMKSFGQLLIIDHGGGYMTLYAHNQELLKTVGDWVLPGEKIALVGDSGGQPRAGLYFEIRYKGRPSNPQAWLRG